MIACFFDSKRGARERQDTIIRYGLHVIGPRLSSSPSTEPLRFCSGLSRCQNLLELNVSLHADENRIRGRRGYLPYEFIQFLGRLPY